MTNKNPGAVFEQTTAELFELMGFTVRHDVLLAGSQVDLLVQKTTGPFSESYIVECKDHAQSVSIDLIRTFYAVLVAVRNNLPGTNGFFVSKAGLTKEARAFAQSVGIQHTTLEELERRLINLNPYANYLIDSFQDLPLSTHYIDLDVHDRANLKLRNKPLVEDLRQAVLDSPNYESLSIKEQEKLRGSLMSSLRSNEIVTVIRESFLPHEASALLHNAAVRGASAVIAMENHRSRLATTGRSPLWGVLEEWLTEQGSSGLMMLGDYGTGKKSCLRYLSAHYARKFLTSRGEARCPLFISLKDYPNGIVLHGLARDISQQVNCPHLDWPLLYRYLSKGRFLLLLDGFDEMGFQVDARLRRMHFASIFKLLEIPNNKVIVTGRPAYFPTLEEYEEIIGLAVTPSEIKDREKLIRTIEVAPFDDRQVTEYIASFADSIEPNKLAEIKEIIDQVYNLKDLAERPFLLDLIVQTLPECGADIVEITPATLYELYTTKWIDREYAKGEFRWLISKQEKKSFMVELALTMFSKAALSVHFSELSTWVTSHFHLSSPETVDYLAHDIRTCSFLRRDDSGRYHFIHRSFMEYFLAVKIVEKVKEGAAVDLLSKGGGFREDNANSIAFTLDLLQDSLANEKEFIRYLFPPEGLFEPLYRLRKLPRSVRRQLLNFFVEHDEYNQDFDLRRALKSPLSVRARTQYSSFLKRSQNKKAATLFCTFCGTSLKKSKLIAGPLVHICRLCITNLLLRVVLIIDQNEEFPFKGKSCSFCGKADRDVKLMFESAARDVRICNECHEICCEIAADDAKAEEIASN